MEKKIEAMNKEHEKTVGEMKQTEQDLKGEIEELRRLLEEKK